MAYNILTILIIFMFLKVGTAFSTGLHLTPEKKQIPIDTNEFMISLIGKKKDSFGNDFYDDNLLEKVKMKVTDEGVIVPQDKIKAQLDTVKEFQRVKNNGETVLDNEAPSTEESPSALFTSNQKQHTDYAERDSKLFNGMLESHSNSKYKNKGKIDKQKEMDLKSERIAKIEKLARENLEAINRLKNETFPETKKLKSDRGRTSGENGLSEELDKAVQQISDSDSSINDSKTSKYLTSESKSNKTTDSSVASFIKAAEKNMEEYGSAPEPSSAVGAKFEKPLKIEAKLDEDPKVELPLDLAKMQKPIEAKNEGNNDAIPPIEAKPEEGIPVYGKPLQPVMEGTMMEAEIMKGKHLKTVPKQSKKKVRILILDEEDVPPKLATQPASGSELPEYLTHKLTDSHNQPYPTATCGTNLDTSLGTYPSHLTSNCQPTGMSPTNVGYPKMPVTVHNNYHTHDIDVCCPNGAIPGFQGIPNPFFPEYLKGYLRRHKIRHQSLHSGEDMENALQPQIHYHFNFMKENNQRNVGTEESLAKNSLTTDWLDRKRGSFAKVTDNSKPLIDKFMSFIKSPGNDIPDPKQTGLVRNTLINSKYANLHRKTANPQSAYKRSKTVAKKQRRTLAKKHV